MRRKTLQQAKLVVTVESYKGKSIVENNPHLTIQAVSVYDNRTNEFWSEERIKERGIKYFLNIDELKETLNWHTNGDSSKYQFKWAQSNKEKSTGCAYIFD